MTRRTDIHERQRGPEESRSLNVRGETMRRIDDIQYASMRKRFLPKAREQIVNRLSVESPVTPWLRGNRYEWTRMPNGTAYAVYDNGMVKVALPASRRPPFQQDPSICPPAVQQKHMEKIVAIQTTSMPRESRETGLKWTTRIQKNSGEKYDYASLSDGTMYAIFHNGPVIKRFTEREGIVDLSFHSAPTFLQQRAMEYRVASASVRAPQLEVPAPEKRQAPAPRAPVQRASPEVTPQQQRAPETPPRSPDRLSNVTSKDAAEAFRRMTFTDKQGRLIDVSLPDDLGTTFFCRQSIPDVRIGQYLQNMEAAARRLQNFVTSRDLPSEPSAIYLTPSGYVLKIADKTILVTERYVFTKNNNDSYTTENGEQAILGSRGTMQSLEFQGRTEYFSPEGSLRMRQSSERIEYFDGSDGTRPSVVMAKKNTELALSDRSYPLRAGIYHVPERGAPIARFEHGKNLYSVREKAQYAMNEQDRSRAQAYVDQAVRSLKTPEAISAFVTSNFDFVSRGGLYGGAIHGEAEQAGEQYAQHPLRTVFLGSGDCEDFAILLQYLCARAKQLDPETGAASFLAKTYETHNAAYYLEEYTTPDGRKAYALCKMHVHGFEQTMKSRNGQPFLTQEAAMRAIWDPRKSSTGVHAEIAEIESQVRSGKITYASVSSYLSTLGQLKSEGGGLILMNKDLRDVNDAGVQEGPARFSADFSAFVRR